MTTKSDKVLAGPSWTEVILGAALAVVLGAALAVVFLVFKPVVTAKELPKEPAKGVTYYLEGSKDAGKARQAAAKQKLFVQGGTVSLVEDELNTLAAPATAVVAAPAAKPTKPGEKPKAEVVAPAKDFFTPGAPNFRLREGVLQIGVPMRISALGLLDVTVPVQARGTLVKQGEGFVFEAETFLFGSLAVHRLPAVQGFVMKRTLLAQKIPDEVAAAWAKLTHVSLEGATLKLAAQ